MKLNNPCTRCGCDDWECTSPDYGSGAWFTRQCNCAGTDVRMRVDGYTKEQSYRDAGRSDLAERFK